MILTWLNNRIDHPSGKKFRVHGMHGADDYDLDTTALGDTLDLAVRELDRGVDNIPINVEFVAKVLSLGRYSTGGGENRTILVASPIYVAEAALRNSNE
jgi:hypothetical protein